MAISFLIFIFLKRYSIKRFTASILRYLEHFYQMVYLLLTLVTSNSLDFFSISEDLSSNIYVKIHKLCHCAYPFHGQCSQTPLHTRYTSAFSFTFKFVSSFSCSAPFSSASLVKLTWTTVSSSSWKTLGTNKLWLLQSFNPWAHRITSLDQNLSDHRQWKEWTGKAGKRAKNIRVTVWHAVLWNPVTSPQIYTKTLFLRILNIDCPWPTTNRDKKQGHDGAEVIVLLPSP